VIDLAPGRIKLLPHELDPDEKPAHARKRFPRRSSEQISRRVHADECQGKELTMKVDRFAATSLCVGGLLIVAALTISVVSRMESQESREYSPGDKVPAALIGLHDSSALVVWVSSRCKFCNESMPLYRRLSAMAVRPPMIWAGREPEAILRHYADQAGIGVDRVVSIADESFALRRTPRLMLLDKEGGVRAIWKGRLDQAAEASVVEAMSEVAVTKGEKK